MTKRSVALVGVLVVMAMIGSSVIGAVSAWATSDAANGTYSVFLPLIMNAIGAMAEVPQGAVMSFNLTSCPSGWTEVINARGRAIVGLPSGGTLTGTVGTALTDRENRTHNHSVNPPTTATSSTGSHSHTVNPPISFSTIDDHDHVWAYFTTGEEWYTYNFSGNAINLVNYGDGMDTSGAGYYPLAEATTYSTGRNYYTTENFHNHTTDIALFNSSTASNHSHTVDIATTSSTTASTSDIMPYIQFLVCEKD